MFDVFSQFNTLSGFLLVIIFILFVISVKKVLGVVKNAMIIVAASVIFPFVGSKILGLPIAADGETIFSFVVLGLFAYFLYLAGTMIYKGLSLAEKATKGHAPHLPHVGGAKQKKERFEFHSQSKDAAPVRAVPIKNPPKSGNWEKDYVEIEDKPAKRDDKGDRKAKMEKIPVIGEDEEDNN